MLVASLFSTVLGTELPGPGSIYLGQDAKFTKPVKLNDTITATACVSEIILEKNRILLETIARNQMGEVVVKGVATIMPPKA
jgi:3-hydroxybutyryl-CoA dehydratase